MHAVWNLVVHLSPLACSAQYKNKVPPSEEHRHSKQKTLHLSGWLIQDPAVSPATLSAVHHMILQLTTIVPQCSILGAQ